MGCRFCRENKVIIDFFNNSISFFSSDESISFLETNNQAKDLREEPVYRSKSTKITGFSGRLVDSDIKGTTSGTYFVHFKNINNLISANEIIEITPLMDKKITYGSLYFQQKIKSGST